MSKSAGSIEHALPLAHANTVPVSSCTDNGTADIGNLRNAITGANPGDMVDLSSLT